MIKEIGVTDHSNAIFLTRCHLVLEGRAARAQTIGSATDFEPVLTALGRTIMRINQDKSV
jgi:hypothetical protein